MTWSQLKNVELQNDRVRLRRVTVRDHDAFSRIVYQDAIWKFFVTRIAEPADLVKFIESAVQDTLNGTRIVFSIEDKHTGRVVGSSAYGNLSEGEKRLEIGWSWVCNDARRTGINRAAKHALIEHAFSALGCERVEFKTDVLNTAARTALRAIGANEEGVLRSFNFMPGGRRRDVVYYSILKSEWPEVRATHFKGVAE